METANNMDIDALNEAEKSVQAANDALDEVEAILLKMKAYAERAIDPAVSDAERRYLQSEVNSLKMELDYLGNNAEYNGRKLFNG